MATNTAAPGAELETKALTLPQQARGLTVTDQATYDGASSFLAGCVALRKEIVAHHAPLKQTTHAAWQAAIAAEKKLLDPVAEAERTANQVIARFRAEEEAKQRERQRLAAEEAQRVADERRRREALEQQERLKRDEEARLAAAADLEAAGAAPEVIEAALDNTTSATAEEVKAVLEQPVFVAPRPVEPTFRPAANQHLRDNWRFEVADLAKLPREYMIPDCVKIGGVVRACKGTTSIPGVRVWNEPSAVTRTGNR